jgi:hypothetical protein
VLFPAFASLSCAYFLLNRKQNKHKPSKQENICPPPPFPLPSLAIPFAHRPERSNNLKKENQYRKKGGIQTSRGKEKKRKIRNQACVYQGDIQQEVK